MSKENELSMKSHCEAIEEIIKLALTKVNFQKCYEHWIITGEIKAELIEYNINGEIRNVATDKKQEPENNNR
jgi:hypothetical protein